MTSDFLTMLLRSERKRVSLEDVWKAFFAVRPDLLADPNRRALLLAELTQLVAKNSVQLPVEDGRSWELRGAPPLPNWVQIVQEAAPTPVNYALVPWVPELGFWPELKANALEAAKSINEFLLKRRGPLPLVPIKERSLEIFGDEKRLDLLRTGGTLFAGRLSLKSIGAFQVPFPLPYRKADAPGRPVLILENHNSFWSFGEWNNEARMYSAVVYGNGEAFRSTEAALTQVLHEVSGVGAEYLGDIDPPGIGIPVLFNKSLSTAGTQVAPAIEFYEWLLGNGIRRTRASDTRSLTADAAAWLGPKLADTVTEMWTKGYWVPQEALGIEALGRYETYSKCSNLEVR